MLRGGGEARRHHGLRDEINQALCCVLVWIKLLRARVRGDRMPRNSRRVYVSSPDGVLCDSCPA
ncbi:hypothetical protein DsansV1_C44g0240651 [Dioscorea sansibarensis]